jgi:hypothetical protein
LSLDGLGHGLDHAGHRVEAAATIGVGADAGQHDAVGSGHRLRHVRDEDAGAVEPGLAGRALEGLGRRVEVARTRNR